MAGTHPRRRIEPRIDLDHRRMLNLTPEMTFSPIYLSFCAILRHTDPSRTSRPGWCPAPTSWSQVILGVELSLESIPNIASYSNPRLVRNFRALQEIVVVLIQLFHTDPGGFGYHNLLLYRSKSHQNIPTYHISSGELGWLWGTALYTVSEISARPTPLPVWPSEAELAELAAL